MSRVNRRERLLKLLLGILNYLLREMTLRGKPALELGIIARVLRIRHPLSIGLVKCGRVNQ
jgi:hypothetical protein